MQLSGARVMQLSGARVMQLDMAQTRDVVSCERG
jgi:hypothetical protein